MLLLWPDWTVLRADFMMPVAVLVIIVALALLIFLTKEFPPEQ